MANPFETEGVFSWFELMTTDTEEAKKFYGELFGWEFQEDNNPEMRYTLIKPKACDEPIAGMFTVKMHLWTIKNRFLRTGDAISL